MSHPFRRIRKNNRIAMNKDAKKKTTCLNTIPQKTTKNGFRTFTTPFKKKKNGGTPQNSFPHPTDPPAMMCSTRWTSWKDGTQVAWWSRVQLLSPRFWKEKTQAQWFWGALDWYFYMFFFFVFMSWGEETERFLTMC